MKFYKCTHCGNFVATINDSGVPMMCCGEPMKEIKANTQENVSLEKHLPVVTVNENLVHVKVGDVIHPMEENHYIEWVLLVTNLGKQRQQLKPGSTPTVTFALLENEKPLEVYEYCNLHGLWKTEIK